jgi:hypothetical protein
MTHRDMLINICAAVDGEPYDPSAFDYWKEKHNKTKEKTMKNALFLAPSYPYAKTVVSNLSKELDRKQIPYIASIATNNVYISTDKVRVEIYYEDPIKWNCELFRHRDAVFGKKELLVKASNTYCHMMIRPKTSLSKYISDEHKPSDSENIEAPTAYIPEIAKVHFNDPMTVVIWDDGTKTMIKCQDGDTYSKETGLAVAIAKKALGNKGNFNEVFKKWIPEYNADKSIPICNELKAITIDTDEVYREARDVVRKSLIEYLNARFGKQSNE